MTARQELELSDLFLLGYLGLIASILRTVIYFQRDAFADPTWASVTLFIWGNVEAELVLIAASLPPLRPFFTDLWRSSSKFMGKLSHSNTTNQSILSPGKDVKKQGFERLENAGVIRPHSEVELVAIKPSHAKQSQLN